jgi:fatty-acyl-CoA synthase
VEPRRVRELIVQEGVTHFCGAPIVLQMLAQLAEAEPFRFESPVLSATGGAPPSPTLLAAMQRLNVQVNHLYGLTETYGPCTISEVQEEWVRLPVDRLAAKMARQGVPHLLAGDLCILDEQGHPVPADGKTMGEVCLRGNTVMHGYYRDPEATAKAFHGGWFHSGDLGVLHGDGYIELRDRAKDIIISGGENISSVEVEDILYKHPAVLFAAVVAKPDSKWGEVPCAFVELKDGAKATEAEIIAFCRSHMSGFKTPKAVVFGSIPKTSTGKIQKFMLRNQVDSAKAISA